MTFIFSLIISLVYSNKNDGSAQSDRLSNLTGLIYLVTMNQAFSNVIPVLNVFLEEKPIISKELSSNAYHSSSYYLAKVLSEIPFDLMNPIIFGVASYYIMLFDQTTDRFGFFLAFLMMECFAATFMGYGIAAIAPDYELGTAMAPPLIIVFVIYAGVFINPDNFPPGSEWIAEISFIRWTFVGLSTNEFSGRTYTDQAGNSITGE